MMMRILYLVGVILMICSIASCDQKEIQYEYYDDTHKIVKSEGEYIDGKLNGLLKVYDQSGNKMEISEWKNGVRDGLTVTFHPNGKIAGEYSFISGNVQGKYKLYYESGTLKKVSNVDRNGFFSDTKSYNPDGRILEMEPYFKISNDTLLLGDTLKIAGTLENVEDSQYFSGSMIIGNQFKTVKGDLLDDTLALASSTFNYYNVSFVPDRKGDYHFIAQLVFIFPTDKKFNNRPLDTLAIFSTEGSVFIK